MRTNRLMRSTAIAVGLLSVALTAGWVTATRGGDPVPDSIVAHGEERYPMANAAEARSFASAWAVVEVKGEMVGPLEGGGAKQGEGYAARSVELVVKSVVWQADSRVALPASFSVSVIGYAVNGGKRIPLIFEESERMEPGNEYLVGLIVESGKITLASPRGVLGMSNGMVKRPTDVVQNGPLFDAFDGLTAPQAGQLLVNTTPAVSDTIRSLDGRLAEFNE